MSVWLSAKSLMLQYFCRNLRSLQLRQKSFIALFLCPHPLREWRSVTESECTPSRFPPTPFLFFFLSLSLSLYLAAARCSAPNPFPTTSTQQHGRAIQLTCPSVLSSVSRLWNQLARLSVHKLSLYVSL